MLIQFVENFKRIEPEKPFQDVFFTQKVSGQQATNSPPEGDFKSPSKNKQKKNLTPQATAQNNNTLNQHDPIPLNAKGMKKVLKKYDDQCNEVDLQEFLQYFNQHMARYEIEPNGNIQSFLTACSKMCTLKHQLVNVETN